MERNDLSTGLRRLAIGTTLASAMTFVTSVFQNLSESLSGSAGILVSLLVLPAGIASLVASIIYLMGLALLYQEHRSYLHSFVCTLAGGILVALGAVPFLGTALVLAGVVLEVLGNFLLIRATNAVIARAARGLRLAPLGWAVWWLGLSGILLSSSAVLLALFPISVGGLMASLAFLVLSTVLSLATLVCRIVYFWRAYQVSFDLLHAEGGGVLPPGQAGA